MKRKSIIVGAFCVLMLCILAACGQNASESAKAMAPIKEAASPNRDDTAFLLGDADGNGVISIDDATLIQCVLCESVADTDGMIALRGDIDRDGLSITDVTLIMRFLAEYDVEFAIGEPLTTAASEPSTAVAETAGSTSPASTAAPEQTTAAPAPTEPAPTQPVTSATNPPQETTEPTVDFTLGENDLPMDYL